MQFNCIHARSGPLCEVLNLISSNTLVSYTTFYAIVPVCHEPVMVKVDPTRRSTILTTLLVWPPQACDDLYASNETLLNKIYISDQLHRAHIDYQRWSLKLRLVSGLSLPKDVTNGSAAWKWSLRICRKSVWHRSSKLFGWVKYRCWRFIGQQVDTQDIYGTFTSRSQMLHRNLEGASYAIIKSNLP